MKTAVLHFAHPMPAIGHRWSLFIQGMGTGRSICERPKSKITKVAAHTTCKQCLERMREAGIIKEVK